MSVTAIFLLMFAVVLPIICLVAVIPPPRFSKENFAIVGVAIFISLIVAATGFYGTKGYQLLDTQLINGHVTEKHSEKVSCEHSYSCNCTETCSGSGKNRSCSKTCQTCYDHSYDIDWVVNSTVGGVKISRVNRQGTETPPRWSRAEVGEAFAKTSSYKNYIKAVPESVFRPLASTLKERYSGKLPKYPIEVYDYYKVDRFITNGFAVADAREWNTGISNVLRSLGPSKQVNLVVVITKDSSPDFATALMDEWIGGKKNDVVVVIGAPQYPLIEWVHVNAWTDNKIFNVKLRDDLLAKETIYRDDIIATIGSNIQHNFKRKRMADYEYLDDEIAPPDWVIGFIVGLLLIGNVGVFWWYFRVRATFKVRRTRSW